MTRYHTRQYRPAFFQGFENGVVRDIPYEEILNAPWCKNFVYTYDDFEGFTIRDYFDELMIEAHYKGGKSLVVGFAVRADHPFASNWRYQENQE